MRAPAGGARKAVGRWWCREGLFNGARIVWAVAGEFAAAEFCVVTV